MLLWGWLFRLQAAATDRGGDEMTHYETSSDWDEARWRQAERVYAEAFDEKGRKPAAVIRRMFDRRMCRLHTASSGGDVYAMALSGEGDNADGVLVVDYFAVRASLRGRGEGRAFMAYIRDWAEAAGYRGIVVEVESDPTPDNVRRIRFWETCGFRPTAYVHHYIWVPEPYRAIYLNLDPRRPLPDDGKTLFRYIERFHKKAYARK